MTADPLPLQLSFDAERWDSVFISWENIRQATSYRLYRCSDSTPESCELINNLSNLDRHDDTDWDRDRNTIPETEYFYRIKAWSCSDSTGTFEASAFSDAFAVTTPSVDSDSDGMPDKFERATGLDPLTDDAGEDHGKTNLEEYLAGTNPQESGDTDSDVNFCTPFDSAVDPYADSLLVEGAEEKRIIFVNPASNVSQQSLLRFINTNDIDTGVEVYAFDDAGNYNGDGPVSFTLAAGAAKQITSQDFENGNSAKGLTGSLCNGTGKWQFVVRSDNTIEVVSLIRTPDGFLTAINDVIQDGGLFHTAYFTNPASNSNQQSFLRVSNATSTSGEIVIDAIDDNGTFSESVTFTLAAYASRQMTIQDLESGNTDKGLAGALGGGTGKWRLRLSSNALTFNAMSLIRTPDGFLTNLSRPISTGGSGGTVYYGIPASDADRETVLRLVNNESYEATVTITGIDSKGNTAPGGDVMLTLGGWWTAKQVTMTDLENGNLAKGIVGSLGTGQGGWRLAISATTISGSGDISIMSLARTSDGFLTNLSHVVPDDPNLGSRQHSIQIFNPGSNSNQRSILRISAPSYYSQGTVTIAGFDDNGTAAPGGEVTINILGGQTLSLTAGDLENGNSSIGLVGALGDGAGKWRLQVSSDIQIDVMNLLETPTGFLTNLSRAIE